MAQVGPQEEDSSMNPDLLAFENCSCLICLQTCLSNHYEPHTGWLVLVTIYLTLMTPFSQAIQDGAPTLMQGQNLLRHLQRCRNVPI